MEIYDLRNSFPINQSVFEGLARSIHKREMVGKKHPRPTTRMACFPGATRTYCSLDGTLYSCEKTEFGDSFALGSVASDIDADRAYRLSEIVRLHCDCANCVASRTCTLCPAEAKASKELPGRLDSQRLRGVCRTFSWMRSLSAQLSEYTEIMEKNPSVLDRLFEGETILNDDWLDHVKLFSERRSRVELSTESLEGF
jgi:hypothetical protein